MSQPDVTIITPCHNSEQYLPQTLKSIEDQSLGLDRIQVILVDDASTDHTWDIISAFEQLHPDQVVAIHMEENVKQGAARNSALPYVAGRYLQFLDSDDLLVPTACENLYLLSEELNLDLVEFQNDEFHEEGGPLVISGRVLSDSLYDVTDNIAGHKSLLISETFDCGHWNKFYRSGMVLQCGATFAENMTMYEEPKFVYPQLLCMKRAATLSTVLHHYRWNSNSSTETAALSSYNALLRHPEAEYQLLYFLKHHPSLYPMYQDVILYHYLWSFYVDTLIFSRQFHRALPLEQYLWMEKTLLLDIPAPSISPYIQESPFLRYCVETVQTHRIRTEEELEKLKDYICSLTAKVTQS